MCKMYMLTNNVIPFKSLLEKGNNFMAFMYGLVCVMKYTPFRGEPENTALDHCSVIEAATIHLECHLMFILQHLSKKSPEGRQVHLIQHPTLAMTHQMLLGKKHSSRG